MNRISTRQLLFDGLLAVAVMSLGLSGTIEVGAAEVAPFTRESDAFHVFLIVLMSGPLLLRRVYPTPVFLVVLTAWVVDRGLDYPDAPAAFGVAVVFYTIGAELDRRASLRIGGGSALFVVLWTGVGVLMLESVIIVSLLTTLISTATPLLLGREMHERRRRVAELTERAERAEREREEKARQAVMDERTRIARELHDVVAHQMTVITLQAEGAKRIADGSDPRVVEALETIGQAGHTALTELRRTVGLLRTSDEESATEPLPRLSDLDHLVDQVRAAGIPVSLEIKGQTRRLSEGAELSAYRIVQESLTNAVRHGGDNVSASVIVEYGESAVDIGVVDTGSGGTSFNEGSGHGLVGMRERVTVLGGEFEAGPRLDGGFQVRASIPVES